MHDVLDVGHMWCIVPLCSASLSLDEAHHVLLDTAAHLVAR